MKIKDLPDSSRPRERFLKFGPKTLSDAELMAIILRTGTVKENVIDVSNRLIKEYSLERLFECSLKELEKISGIGPSKAMQILAISELGKRYNSLKSPVTKITCSKDVYNYFKEKLQREKQENFYILILNNANNIVKEELISVGILNEAIIHAREVFKPAIKHSASKIILIHNHPSGNPAPSDEDIRVTRELIEAGKLLDIKVLDHVIIGSGENGFWSWTEDDSRE